LLQEIVNAPDPLWHQIRLEAEQTLKSDPKSGPAVYNAILSQPSLITAVIEHVSNVITSQSTSTHVLDSTSLSNLFHDTLTPLDVKRIR